MDLRKDIGSEKNRERGEEAASVVLERRVNRRMAMWRKSSGWIAMLYGTPGSPPDFEDAEGVAGIIARIRHANQTAYSIAPKDLILRLVEVLAKGRMKRKYGPPGGRNIEFEYQGLVALVSWSRHERTFFLNGWRELVEGALPAGMVLEGVTPWRQRITGARSYNDLSDAFWLAMGREGTTQIHTPTDAEATRDPAGEAMKTLESLQKVGGSMVANAIAKAWENKAPAPLVGLTIQNTKDLAILGQVYRNPSFETFRMFFVDASGKVTHQTGVTSRLPAASGVFPSDMTFEEFASDIKERMTRSGVTGFYLLHNHPSGNPDASAADKVVTEKMGSAVPGFLGHVIVNHQSYGVIKPGGRFEIAEYTDQEGYDINTPALPHETLAESISTPGDLVRIAKRLASPGAFQIVGRRAKGRVGGIATVPEHCLEIEPGSDRHVISRKAEEVAEMVRDFARSCASPMVFAINVSPRYQIAIMDIQKHTSIFKDIVLANGLSLLDNNPDLFDGSNDLGLAKSGMKVTDWTQDGTTILESILTDADLVKAYPPGALLSGMILERSESWQDDVESALTFDTLSKALKKTLHVAKEVWQMSVEEFRDYHKRAVRRAVADGRIVGSDVLEQYRGEPWADEVLAGHKMTGSATRGKIETVYLPNNTPLEIQYVVVEIADVTTSHDDAMNLSDHFPQELQPRDRKRDGVRLQVEQMAKNITPERLGASHGVTSGAPIVGDDLVVESGNGRSIAMRKAYRMGEGERYRAWLVEQAEEFGILKSRVEAMKEPFLVRERMTRVDRSEFARQANQDEIARMSPAEQARADAERVTDDDMDLFSPSEDGSVIAASNSVFVGRFLARLGTQEAAGFMTADGKPTKQLVDRIQAAVFAKAYDDDSLIELQAESTDPRIKNVLSALTFAAGGFAKARAMAGGNLGALDIPSHAIAAAKLIKQTREEKVPLEDALNQTFLFGGGIPEETKTLARMIDANIRSAKRMSHMFRYAADKLREVIASKDQMGLFGDDPGPSPSEIIDGAIARGKEDDQPTLF